MNDTTDCLFNEMLVSREFGMAALTVHDLKQWVQSIGAALPIDIDQYHRVQIESLLSSIELVHLRNRTPSEADMINCIKGQDDEIERGTSMWAVGADVHLAWRDQVRNAIATGALRPVDVLTGLPVGGVAPLAVPEVRAKPSHSKNKTDARQAREVEAKGLMTKYWRIHPNKSRDDLIVLVRDDFRARNVRNLRGKEVDTPAVAKWVEGWLEPTTTKHVMPDQGASRKPENWQKRL